MTARAASQPVTFSFIKTGANTWAYEASLCRVRRPICPAPIRSRTGTMSFNSDGTLANVERRVAGQRARSP